MSPKSLGGVLVLWTVLQILASSMDGLFLSDGGSEVLGGLLAVQFERLQGAGIVELPGIAGGMALAFWSMLVWDYPYLSNTPGLMLKIVMLYPISLAAMLGFLSLVWPILSSRVGVALGVVSVITAGATWLRSLWPF